MGEINWKDKCFVATIYLVNEEGRVLLSWNKNMQAWIPVGGHMEVGDTPEEAVKREVAEEVGIDFEFVSRHKSDTDGNVKLVRAHRVQLDPVPHHNIHINFNFIGKCKNTDKQETDEQEKLRWFSREEIVNIENKMPQSVRTVSLEAMDLVGNRV